MLTAVELFENLNVPVGFVNATIGSTGIEAWMSKDAINGSDTVVDVLKNTVNIPTPRRASVLTK